MRCSGKLSKLISQSPTSKLHVTFLLAIVTDTLDSPICSEALLPPNLPSMWPLLRSSPLVPRPPPRPPLPSKVSNYPNCRCWTAKADHSWDSPSSGSKTHLERYYEAIDMPQTTSSQMNSQSLMVVLTSNQMANPLRI